MGVVGKHPNQRRRVSVKSSVTNETSPDASNRSPTYDTKTDIGGLHTSPSNIAVPSAQEVAAYLAAMCSELVVMAKVANLPFVAHLLAMAQAEAESAAEQVS